jgi:DNA-binding response OmpR family regulator
LPKLLIVDDDIRFATELQSIMLEHGWTVEMAHNGKDGLQLLRNFVYEFILLDWNMPDATGPEICRKFRSEGGMTPIVFLTGRSDVADKEAGLDAGGDDYLTKPFESRELLARIRSVQRRAPTLASPNPLKVRDLELVPALRTVERGKKQVQLSPMESKILEYLISHRNQCFTAGQLFEAVWPSESEGGANTVRVHMKYLRTKLDRIGAGEVIETVSGGGYVVRDT